MGSLHFPIRGQQAIFNGKGFRAQVKLADLLVMWQALIYLLYRRGDSFSWNVSRHDDS
jgi:hypothetical protein